MKIEEFVGSKAAGAENAFKEIAPVFLKFESNLNSIILISCRM